MIYLKGILLGLVPIILYYLYVYGMLRLSNVTYMIKELKAREWIYIGIIFLASLGISSILLHQNDYIYYYDYCMHWTPAVSFAKRLFIDPQNILRQIWLSIGTSDYNHLMPLLYALPCRVFGIEYVDTVLVVQFFYMFPVYIVISIYINAVLKKLEIGKKSIPLYVLFVATIPLIENVLLRAILDPPVLMISTLILIMLLDYDYSEFNLKKNIMLAIGVLALVILRRHWAYWVVGLICYMFISFLFQINKLNYKSVIKNSLLSALFIGAICIVILLFPFRDFLMHSLRNYEGLYVAWNGSVSTKLQYVRKEFGILVEIAIISIPIIIWKLKKRSSFVINSLIMILVPSLIMSRSVIMHHSHFYLVIVQILLLIAVGLNCIIDSISKKNIQRIVGILMVIFFVFNYMNYAFFNFFGRIDNVVYNHLFKQNEHYQVLYRSDVDTIRNLVSDINKYTDSYETGVYVCAGSSNLNDSVLLAVNQPKEFRAVHNMLPISAVDLRDGFNTNFFDAGIVVVEDASYNLENNYTKNIYGVVWYLSDLLQDENSYLGKHFELLGTYELQNQSTAKIYHKISELEESDYIELMDFYDQLYPNNKNIFSERIQNYINEKNTKIVE